nr:reverse transcriptase domain-containing protein [Tanacetum cinerariifolium]
MNNGQGGSSYKEIMACSLKDYDGEGGAIVYTRWIEKMELVQTRGREAVVGMTWDDFKTLTRDEFYPNNEIQKLETKFWCHIMVRVGHTTYTNRLYELARLVPHLVTPENKRIKRARPRVVTPVNTRNLTAVRGACFECGEEARQDPNIMTGIEPSDIGFSYEIEIANGQLVQINKIIRDCKLEIEELFSDYDCEIRYHPGKTNVKADALSRKERINQKRVRAMNITIQLSIKDMILTAQNEASEVVNAPTEMLQRLDKQMERRSDGAWLARLYLNEIVAMHGVPVLIISDHDSRFTLRFWQSMQEALGTRLDMSVVRFGKKGKLALRFVGPFEITKRISPVAYKLRLPEELNCVQDTFYV